MEVVAVTASIIAIVEFAAKTASVVNDFRREYRDAPNEVKLLADQLGLIRSTLDFIGHLHDRNVLQSLQLPESLRANLQRALVHTKSSISYTHQQCSLIRTKYRNTVKGRLSWASSDHKKILNLLQQLRDTQASLSVLLSLLQP
jgi:Prion-inhibition and propagation